MLHPERRAYMMLARSLRMGVEEMLDRLSSREITDWFALWRVEEVERKQEEARSKGRRGR